MSDELRNDVRRAIVSPVVSEKSYGLLDENKYTFIVAPDANKTQIKIAVEQVFGVRVTSVNTMNREGKRVRTRRGFGRRAATKRAIVSVAQGDRIGRRTIDRRLIRYVEGKNIHIVPVGEIAGRRGIAHRRDDVPTSIGEGMARGTTNATGAAGDEDTSCAACHCCLP